MDEEPGLFSRQRPESVKIDCKIQPLDCRITTFGIQDVEYDPQLENSSSVKIRPEIHPSQDLKEHLVTIGIEARAHREGKVCDLKVVSEFSIQFLLPYRILNHVSTDFLINIFSQLFLYCHGQLQGVWFERTRGTVLEGYILQTRFVDSLYLTTKDKLLDLTTSVR